MKQRSLLLFENTIKSKATKIEYLKNLNRFKDFYKLKDYDSILGIPDKKLQEMIEDYVMGISSTASANRSTAICSLPSTVTALFLIFCATIPSTEPAPYIVYGLLKSNQSGRY